MDTVLMAVAMAAYAYIAFAFFINCSMELANQGRIPPFATAAFCALWPITVVLAIFARR